MERRRSHQHRTNASGHNRECEQPHAARFAWGFSQQEPRSIWHVVWYFGTAMQHNTRHVRHTVCCSRFAGKFWNTNPVVLIWPRDAIVCLGRWSNPWGVADSTVMRKSEWLFVNSFESKSSIFSLTECLDSCQDRTDSLNVWGIMF